MDLTPNQKSYLPIKYKVILGFSISIAALLVAAIIIYRSFVPLLDSINVLSRPDRELNLLNKVLIEISELEIKNLSYINDHRSGSIPDLLESNQYILKLLDSLKRTPSLPQPIVPRVDSIQTLLRKIPENVKDLLVLEARADSVMLSGKTQKIVENRLDALQAEVDDYKERVEQYQTEVKEQIATDTLSQDEKWELKKEAINDADSLSGKEKRQLKKEARKEIGKKGFLKKIFSKKEEAPTESSPPPIYTRELDNETVDEKLNEELTYINSILAKDQQERAEIISVNVDKQKEVLEHNRIIIQYIRYLVADLEKKAEQDSKVERQEASNIAQNTSLGILALALFSSLMAIVLTSLIFSDITRSKALQKQIEASKNKAENTAATKEKFLNNMSHEIRTPLHAIQGYTELMLKQPQNTAQQESLEAIQGSTRHLLRLVNDILELSKIEAQKLVLEEAEFSVRELIESVHAVLKAEASLKQIAFTYHVDPEAEVLLIGDAFRLTQVLYNLVGNAIKFTDEGSVHLHTEIIRENDQKVVLVIDIADTGIGMSEAEMKKLFRRFQQADTSISRRYGGSGLGLDISREIIKAMKGKITLKSKVGEGTVFNLRIPLQESHRQLVASPPTESLAPALYQFVHPAHVLVIDDDSLNLKLCGMMLRNFNLVPHLLSQPQKALALIQQEKFDLILVDMRMPELAGTDIIRQVRSLEDQTLAQTPILVVSANIFIEDTRKYIQAGANDTLHKPFREEELFQKIQHYLKDNPHTLSNSHSNMAKSNPSSGSSSAGQPYNLEEIKQYCMGDEGLFEEVVEEFLKESKANLLSLNSYVEQQNWLELRELVHQMYARFAQFKIHQVAKTLRQMEQIIDRKGDTTPIPALAKQVITQAQIILPQIKAEVLGN